MKALSALLGWLLLIALVGVLVVHPVALAVGVIAAFVWAFLAHRWRSVKDLLPGVAALACLVGFVVVPSFDFVWNLPLWQIVAAAGFGAAFVWLVEDKSAPVPLVEKTAPWRIQASHVPESWGEPDGRWIVVPDQEPPDPEPLFLAENLPGSDDPVSVYIENVKRAHRIGGRKPKPTKPKPLIWDPARVKTEAVASPPVRPEDVPPTHPMRRAFEDAGLPWPPR